MNEKELLQNIYRTTFVYNSGNVSAPISYQGTCFGISVKCNTPDGKGWVPKHYYVTSRHCVDYFGYEENKNSKNLRLSEVKIVHRWWDNTVPEGYQLLSVEVDRSSKILVHENPYNDIALIEANNVSPTPPQSYWNLDLDRVPDKKNFHSHIGILENVYFFGFPGSVWDGENHLAIGRNAMVASMSELNYSPESQKEKKADRVLVSGMSFSGSSGSIVMEQAGGILGVMSGHYAYESTKGRLTWAHDLIEVEDARPIMKQAHAGLSYFIKGYVIRDILSNPKELTWGANPDDWNNDTCDWKN